MRSGILASAFFVTIVMNISAETPDGVGKNRISATKLSPIPDAEGFAGTFAGVSGGALVVGGGANIAGDKWTKPLKKKWYDSVFVLEKPDGKWKSGFQLPRPVGYGVSVTADDAVWCFGGSDSTRHYAESFRLEWKNRALRSKALPALPLPCANACGALVGRTVYIAGGIEQPTATEALHTFWALDLDAPELIWHELEPWPGPARMLATAGALDGSFYLFSGTALKAGPDGKPVREYLRDAYRYTPQEGWKRLADLPRAAVAAASPAPVVLLAGTLQLAVISGDDGLNVDFKPIENHPGFPREVCLYISATDGWSQSALPDVSLATVPAVPWNKTVVLPNGEVRPRVRTPNVLSLNFPPHP